MLRSIRICLQSQPVIVDPQLVGMSFMNVFNTLTEKDPTHAFIESAPRGPGLPFHADSLFVHSDHLLQEESDIVDGTTCRLAVLMILPEVSIKIKDNFWYKLFAEMK